jgi:hypothetical protein
MTAYDLFYRGVATAVHPTFVNIKWLDFRLDDSNPEDVPRDSYRIWHGPRDREIWRDMGEFAFAPISRIECPDTFAEIAAAHGVPDPSAGRGRGAPPRAAVDPRPLPSDADGSDDVEVPRTAMQWQQAADAWLAAVRAYGNRTGNGSHVLMPNFLSMRRDMSLHPYALWVVVQVRSGSCLAMS